MSHASVNDSAVLDAPGVSPSACNCDQKNDEEVKPAGMEPRGNASVSSPFSTVAQFSHQQACPCGKGKQSCSCGKNQPPQLVFALGALWFDFGTEARYDALVQQPGDPIRANNPAELFAFLRQNPHFAAGITFILMQDQIPLYAIQPAANVRRHARCPRVLARRHPQPGATRIDPRPHCRIDAPAERHDGAGRLPSCAEFTNGNRAN